MAAYTTAPPIATTGSCSSAPTSPGWTFTAKRSCASSPEWLTVLFRDEHIVVIDKPPGLLVHRSEIDRHETRFAIQILRNQIGRRVWAAHRLDRGTSGALLFALDGEVASALGRQFAAGTVVKRYWAVVRGHPPDAGIIDHPLSRQRDPYAFAGTHSSTEAQAAVTNYPRLLARV